MSIVSKFDDVVQTSWTTTLHYIDMEDRIKSDSSLNEEEKLTLKSEYEIKQINLE